MDRTKELEELQREKMIQERGKLNGEDAIAAEEETPYKDDQDKTLMAERKELIEELFEKAESYIKINVEITKLKAVDKLAMGVSSFAAVLLVFLFFSFFYLMVNVGIAVWLGQSMGAQNGYFVVAGFNGVLALIIYLFRDSFVKKPIINALISQFLK